MRTKARDATPTGSVLLSVAFDRYCKGTIPNLPELEARYEEAFREQRKIMDVPQPKRQQMLAETREAWRKANPQSLETFEEWQDAGDAINSAVRDAELRFRAILATGKLIAHIRDFRTGDVLDLDHREWAVGENFLCGFNDDFVDPEDFCARGPLAATDDGKLRPVFFWLQDFEAVLSKSPAKVRAPNFQRAQEALRNRYPAGIPSPSACPNKKLVKEVTDYLKTKEQLTCTASTILRAAGRKAR